MFYKDIIATVKILRWTKFQKDQESKPSHQISMIGHQLQSSIPLKIVIYHLKVVKTKNKVLQYFLSHASIRNKMDYQKLTIQIFF